MSQLAGIAPGSFQRFMQLQKIFLPLILLTVPLITSAQDSAILTWKVMSRKLDAHTYEVLFTTRGNAVWQLYAPNQVIADVPAAELQFADSSIRIETPIKESGKSQTIQSSIFDSHTFHVYEGPATFGFTVTLTGAVPARLIGTFQYAYGRGNEFYPATLPFEVALEGGTSNLARIKIPSIDVKSPVNSCGGTGTEGSKSLWGIFILGFAGGLVGLIMPCTFPMIPLTVSFFTKQSGNRRKGIGNACLYGFFIFLIYVLLSLPFYFLDASNTDILNNISTNAWLNIFFAIVFFLFALSFFGLFEIVLPSRVTNTVGSKSGSKNLGGIFFMALTLAIVSFSCTGPILGSLLVGALNQNGGAMQLTVAMAGFGLALGLPFALFAMFPSWLSSLPRSGGWMNTVKITFAFIELALMIKFLSNADLVMHWGILKREVFFGLWIATGLCLVLYLFGILKFRHDPPPAKLGILRIFFGVIFLFFVVYLVPGLTNTRWANRSLVSGFPPPLSYSIYSNAPGSKKGVEANVVNDYEKALQLAKAEGKPLLIDFTGWACVNCRKMEENVWPDVAVKDLIENKFVLLSLYVDDRRNLDKKDQLIFTTSDGSKKTITTIGDKYSTFQAENFENASQPLYAVIDANEKLLTLPVGYTPQAQKYSSWLQCGINAFEKSKAGNGNISRK